MSFVANVVVFHNGAFESVRVFEWIFWVFIITEN